jgi:hypothetical protein
VVLSKQEVITCSHCDYQLDPGMARCPECGTPRPLTADPPGMSLGAIAAMILWPVAGWVLTGLSLLDGRMGGAILVLLILVLITTLVNGPIALVVIRNRHVRREDRTLWPLGDLYRHRRAAAVLTSTLLGLAWGLPVLAFGACVVMLSKSSLH